MSLKKGVWWVVLFNVVYVLAFAVYYISIKNFEFLWYIAVLVFFMVVIISTLNRSKFDYFILWGLSIWGLLHMSGGGLIVNGSVLYNLQLVHLFDIGDTFVLKFDQIVHAFGFFMTTFVAYHLLKPYLNNKTNWKIVYPILIATSMGLGALNEIVEFIATISFANVNVGGYTNTALDIIANTIGATIAVIIIHFRRVSG